jgi:hypothetical protein
VLDFSGLTVQWPWALLSFAILPLFCLAWRRSRLASLSHATLYPGLRVSQQNTYWSYAPIVLFLLGGLLLCIGLARPSALFSMPLRQLDLGQHAR